MAETKSRDVLIPDRHPQHDLFVCDVADAILKDIHQEMEHPFYSLSKKPVKKELKYEHNGNWIRIIPSIRGLATIYDKDILIYCISQVMAKLNRGERVSRRIRLNSRDFLIFTNRGTGGKDYNALIDSLERLGGTRISTNIKTGDEEQFDNFGLIDASSVRRKFGKDGRILWVELELSDWVFNAIRKSQVLTLHPDYFRLRKPLERRVYELARKHVGSQKTWKCSVEVLHKKSGSLSPKKHFKYLLQDIVKTNHLPDYSIAIDGDNVLFFNKGTMLPEEPKPFSASLKSETYERARTLAPGWDVRAIEQEWRSWVTEGKMSINNPDSHYLKFCSSWFNKRGTP